VPLQHPLEAVKARLQLNGRNGSKPLYRGTLHCFCKVMSQGNIYRGVGVSLSRNFVVPVTRFTSTAFARNTFEPGLLGNIGIAASVGILMGIMEGPIERTLRFKFTTKNISTIKIWKKLFRQEGVRAPFKGNSSLIARNLTWNTLQLPIFIETKKVFEKNTELHPILNSIASGFICAIPVSIAVLPLDFVKIRSQGLSTMTTRKIIQQTRKTEGTFAFWKGFTAFTLRNPLPLIMVDVFSYLYLQKGLN